jgi:hypothetical protein
MFVPDKLFNPSLMFVDAETCFTQVGSDLTRKHWTTLERLARDTNSLSFYENSLITVVEYFMALAPAECNRERESESEKQETRNRATKRKRRRQVKKQRNRDKRETETQERQRKHKVSVVTIRQMALRKTMFCTVSLHSVPFC